MSHPNTHRIREDRVVLLGWINAAYPSGQSHDDLVAVMYDLPDPSPEEHTERDLAYLEARGLIESYREPRGPYRRQSKMWRLTAKGLTFIEHGSPWAELERI
jgi:hypothetical protein